MFVVLACKNRGIALRTYPTLTLFEMASKLLPFQSLLTHRAFLDVAISKVFKTIVAEMVSMAARTALVFQSAFSRMIRRIALLCATSPTNHISAFFSMHLRLLQRHVLFATLSTSSKCACFPVRVLLLQRYFVPAATGALPVSASCLMLLVPS